MARIRIEDLSQTLEGEQARVLGGVPNTGATNTVIIQSGSALVANSSAAMAANSSRSSLQPMGLQDAGWEGL